MASNMAWSCQPKRVSGLSAPWAKVTEPGGPPHPARHVQAGRLGARSLGRRRTGGTTLIDLAAQCSPARKAVLTGDDELRGREIHPLGGAVESL